MKISKEREDELLERFIWVFCFLFYMEENNYDVVGKPEEIIKRCRISYAQAEMLRKKFDEFMETGYTDIPFRYVRMKLSIDTLTYQDGCLSIESLHRWRSNCGNSRFIKVVSLLMGSDWCCWECQGEVEVSLFLLRKGDSN